jgi:hypothetical protein
MSAIGSSRQSPATVVTFHNSSHCNNYKKMASFCKNADRTILRCNYFSDLFLIMRLMALSRRPSARPSYRSSLMSSGSARRSASADRSGSSDGKVARRSIGSPNKAFPAITNFRWRRAFVTDPKRTVGPRAPKAKTRSTRAILTFRMCSSSSWASAASRAYCRMISLLVWPTILQDSLSICFLVAALDGRLKLKPWR